MKYYIFRQPRKEGDEPIETLNYMSDIIIQQRALKYGNIVVVSEEDLKKEEQK